MLTLRLLERGDVVRKKLPWQKSEQLVADLVHGRRQPASGSRPGFPGDIRQGRIKLDLPNILVEVKSTEKESLSVKKAWLVKISNEALSLGKTPILAMTIGTQRWFAIPDWALDDS